MIDRALASNATPETLERLLALQERWEANEARKAFDAALAAAKSEIPVINKNREVGYDHKSGEGKTNYRHEDLGEIARIVAPILATHGLSYRFRPSSEPNQPVSVTCIISHRDGHSEETTLSAGRDESGKKNSIQAIGSTITYLQRYTLKAALGLAASHDDDGSKADEKQNEVITEEQRDRILDLIVETDTDIEQFCKVGKMNSIGELLAVNYENAIRILEQKKQRMAK
ncbi:ERF family protein [Ochrobactrum sp. Marseille-Q0166]|nr:ERF family protein [Ochrobactrum sp. Marseille-Q0166]